MPTTYEPIATQTLGSAASSITFSSISGTYTDLRLVFSGTGSGGTLLLTFNATGGSSYSSTMLAGYGAAYSSRTSNAAFLYALETELSSTIPKISQIDIFSYSGSTNKTCLIASSENFNTDGAVIRRVGLFRSTGAITSIKLEVSGFTINEGSTATLYGIKNA